MGRDPRAGDEASTWVSPRARLAESSPIVSRLFPTLRGAFTALVLLIHGVKAGAQAQAQAGRETEPGTIVVGIAWTPSSYLPAHKAESLELYEAELARSVARTQGLQVAFKLAPLAELWGDLASGRIDVIPSLARTFERQSLYDVTVPHTRMQTGVFVRKGGPGVRSLRDLAGRRVLVVQGSYSQELVQKLDVKAELLLATSVNDAVKRLAEGEGDCLMTTQDKAFVTIKVLGVKNLVLAGPPLRELIKEHCMFVRDGNRELLAKLNDGLFILKQTGELDRIYEKWMGVLEPPAVSRARAIRYTAIGLGVLLLAGGLGWLAYRTQVMRARTQLAEIERRVAERTEELAASKARFQAVVENTPAGIVLVDLQNTHDGGKVVDCNELTCRMHGYTKEELLGSPYNRLRVKPLTQQQLQQLVADLRARGRRQELTRHRRKDASPLDVEFYATSIVLSGREHLLVIILDVTDRLRAEAALRRTEEFQRLVLQATDDGIFEWDIATDTFKMSERGGEMLGYPQSELPATRKEWVSRLHPDDAAAAEEAWQRHLAGGAPYVHSARFLHRDGRVRWLLCRAQTLRDDLGRPVRMVGSCTDITDLKRLDEELQLSRRLRAIGELVGGIAHEFNNLLTPILLQAGLLSELQEVPQEVVSQLRPISDAARRAQALTQRLLQFGRGPRAEMEHYAFGAIVESTLGLVRTTIDRRIEIRTRCDPGLRPLRLNATTMGQVVMNLLLNARDALLDKLAHGPATTWRPRIEITVDREWGPARIPGLPPNDAAPRPWQCLTVADNGAGIAADIKERIFEPFFTTKSVGQGTGLGLAMVWNSAVEAGGWVEVDSQPDAGTRFRLYFPEERTGPEMPFPPAEIQRRENKAPRQIARKCLLVDDDEGVGQTISQFLRHLGHEVRWLRNGDEALGELSAATTPWDVFITDLNMAGLGGEALVEAARRAGYRGRIVVISGHVTASADVRLRAAGVESILLKPFEYHQLKTVFQQGWPEGGSA